MPHTDCSEKVPTICLGSCCYMKMLEVSKKIPSDHCHTVQYTLVPIPSFSLRCQAPVVNRQKCERFHSRQQFSIRYIFSNVKIQTYKQLTTNTDQSFDQPAKSETSTSTPCAIVIRSPRTPKQQPPQICRRKTTNWKPTPPFIIIFDLQWVHHQP